MKKPRKTSGDESSWKKVGPSVYRYNGGNILRTSENPRQTDSPEFGSATAFAILFSLIQGCFSAVLSLAMGNLAAAYGLQRMMFWMVTVPYAVNAVYWFLFYPFYPRDRAAIAGGSSPGRP